jgi:hypothetical protein
MTTRPRRLKNSEIHLINSFGQTFCFMFYEQMDGQNKQTNRTASSCWDISFHIALNFPCILACRALLSRIQPEHILQYLSSGSLSQRGQVPYSGEARVSVHQWLLLADATPLFGRLYVILPSSWSQRTGLWHFNADSDIEHLISNPANSLYH